VGREIEKRGENTTLGKAGKVKEEDRGKHNLKEKKKIHSTKNLRMDFHLTKETTKEVSSHIQHWRQDHLEKIGKLKVLWQ